MSNIDHSIEHRRSINVFVLAMLSIAVVISLRNLPLTAEYGFSSLFFYIVSVLFFMLPYAFVSAELASGWPKAGGVYVWVREALGERWGFFAIWMQWFHNMTWYPAMLSFVAAGIAYIFDPALVHNKLFILSIVLGGFWGITFYNFLGIKASSWTSTICVILGVLIPGGLLIYLGAMWMFKGMPLSFEVSAKTFWPDLKQWTNLAFLGGIFLSLAGLEANANLARDVKHPKKNYPRAIFIAAGLTVFILVFGSLSIAAVIPKHDISLVAGLFDAFHSFFKIYNLSWLIPFIAIFTVIGAVGELNAWAIAGVKGLFVTTEHGSLPPVFHKLNKRHVPVNLLFFQAIIVTIASLIIIYMPNLNVAYWILSALSSQMYLLMYILLLISGVVLRYKRPEVERPYQLPFKNIGMWVCCILGVLSSIFAIYISCFPPKIFQIKSILIYELLVIGGLAVCIVIPLIIYQCRKPHWKIEVLQEIRDEIHQSMH